MNIRDILILAFRCWIRTQEDLQDCFELQYGMRVLLTFHTSQVNDSTQECEARGFLASDWLKPAYRRAVPKSCVELHTGKNPSIVQKHTNTVDIAPDEYIVSKVLRQASVSVPEPAAEAEHFEPTDSFSGSSLASSGFSNISSSTNHLFTTKLDSVSISYGGLTEPSAQWAAKAIEFEKYFKKHHGDSGELVSLRKGREVIL